MKIKISILGSTGSIGVSTLKIIESKKKLFSIDTLMANSNYQAICKQIIKYKPKNFVVNDFKTFNKVIKRFNKSKVNFFNNQKHCIKKNKQVDIVVCAIPGIQGLKPTLDFAKIGKKLLIANKESIICGWKLLSKIIKKKKNILIPIDSEHYSISKLLESKEKDNLISKIFITASGGPFFMQKKIKKIITPQNALRHPIWSMGKKISIDSATMMNKVLELSEAQKLFNKHKNKIEIVIHPQSLIHAIIEYKNGLTKLLYHEPNMIIPIANAIFDEKIKINEVIKVDSFNKFEDFKKLNFYKTNKKNFPPFKILSRLNDYESSPIIINAANEILVDMFLTKTIAFKGIIKGLTAVLNHKNYKKYAIKNPNNLNNIYAVDTWARSVALKTVETMKL